MADEKKPEYLPGSNPPAESYPCQFVNDDDRKAGRVYGPGEESRKKPGRPPKADA
jgi:hypothetical protein